VRGVPLDFSLVERSRSMFRTLVCLVLVGCSAAAWSQSSYQRAGTWEAGLVVLDTSSDTANGQQGTSLSVDGDIGWGGWGAYNFTNRVAVGVDYTYLSPKYRATYRLEDTGELQSIRHVADVANLQVKGTFYFLEGPLTPYVEVGAGWAWVDSNVASGPPTTGCWWDPWWGYICRPYYNTYNDRNTSYSAAVGFRWELSADYVLRADYGIFNVDTSAASESIETSTLRVGFAWRF
jgi:Outer membrane protein beta-barrel domain